MPHAPLPTAQIRHTHNLHHQARPPGEMLCPLPLASFRVILFPCKARFLPGFEDRFDEVET
jgi:hypothetical protein